MDMPQDVAGAGQRYNVGGVMLDRPFKIQRLGHFGFNVDDTDACVRFYSGLLGLRNTDTLDLAPRFTDQSVIAGRTQTKAYFFNHGTDHHSFALFPRPVLELLAGKPARADMLVNQVSWQVGSLREVRDALDWLKGQGNAIHRIGRDMPGSNWHSYPYDAEGHINEIYYGMEQIGWNLRSKPRAMYDRGFKTRPELPQVSEYEEIRLSESNGVDLTSGHRIHEQWPLDHDVSGVLLARPFKVNKIGPVRLWVKDVDHETDCYTRLFGLRISEEAVWNGQRCVFLRANTEHHSLALYPEALRPALGLTPTSSCFSIGFRVGSYTQLRDAIGFLEKDGVEIRYLPQELFPGMDYTAFAIDPQGHAVQLYAYMEQIGWDGRPRPAATRRQVEADGSWPETLQPLPDEGCGEVFLGPLG
jgi:catechol 2,3-dioxygenase-like lactoylglutathione lyase family enzyme